MKKVLIVLGFIGLSINGSAQSLVIPDSSFGINGRLAIEVGISSSGESGMGRRAFRVLPNGKMLIATTAKINQFNSNRNYWLARLNEDGSIDETFGEAGKVLIFSGNDGVGNSFEGFDIAFNNKIVICGQRKDPFSLIEEALIIQLNADGSLDSSFGIEGEVVLRHSPINSTTSARDVKYLEDGKIIILTQVRFAASVPVGLGQEFCLTQLNSDGSFDNSFGNNGVSIIVDAETADSPSRLAIQGDGKILAAGTSTVSALSKYKLLRLNSNGVLDESFGTNGIVIVERGTENTPNLNDLILSQEGNILSTGNWSVGGGITQLTIVRMNSSGELDDNFDTDGIVNLVSIDVGSKLLIDENNKILAMGRSFNEVKLARFNDNGSIDNSFGNNGIGNLGTSNPSSTDLTAGFALDGKLFIGGKWVENDLDYYSIVKVRYDDPGIPTILNPALFEDNLAFPNPTEGFIHLNKMQTIRSAEIFDLTGKVALLHAANGAQSIDLRTLSSGMYILKTTSTEGTFRFQYILKQ